MGYEQTRWHRLWRFVMVVSMLWSTGFVLPLTSDTATATAAARASNYLLNGSFENVTGGVPDNWSVVGTVIDLGVTRLGGCVSIDSTDYSTYAGGPTYDITDGTHSSFTATIVTSGGFGVPTDGTNAVRLDLGGGNSADGYHVKHGPAIVSDEFKGIAGQVITLNWYSAAGSDDFAVLGYLLDTDANGNGVAEGTVADCAQTEILDTHGKTVSGWQFATVTVPDTRDFYKFVFVNGTHDFSGGRASGASFWIDNISQGEAQTVTFSLSGVTANYYAGNSTAPFQLPGTSSSGMAVSYSSSTTSKCTVTSSGVLTVVGAGLCTITALQSGGETGGVLYAASPSVTQSFTITNIAATAQTITFVAPADRMATDADFDLSATASSGLAVTYTSSTPSVCTVSGVTVSMVATGTCTIVAAQAGGANSGTNYATAPTVTRSFLSKGVQTVTFGALSDKDSTAANFAVSATSSAGLTVTYTSTTPSVCTVTSGGTVDVLTPGTCTISADQAGGATGGVTYIAASSVTQSFTVRTPQAITFAAPSDVDQTAAAFALAATADSGLAVTYTSTTPSVCTVTSSGTVTMVSYGTCTIVAAQVGGTNSGTSYSAATSVTRSFVSRRTQTITFGALGDQNVTAADFAVTATSDSGLAVTYTSTTSGTCTVTSGGTVSIVASGLCTIVAAQTGGTSGGIVYATAATVSQSFTIRTGQVITFAQPADIDASAATVTLGATTSSPLTVTYTSSTPSVCTVTSAGVVTLLTYGTCTITATQSGGVSGGVTYAAATSVTRSFESRRAQTITFALATPINRVYTSGDFAVSATAFSTLPVTFSSSTPSICTVSGTTVSLVTVGTCTVVAAQPGGVSGGITYAAAPTVSRSFSSLGVPQTITFPAIPPKRDYDADFPLPATASSGLPVTYVTNNTSVCTIVPTRRLHIYGVGTCTVTAAQTGGTIGGVIYAAAPTAQQTFVITDETPTPSRTATRTATVTNTPTNTATRTPTPPGIQLKKAAIGASFTLGLLMNGTLVTWGMNKEYQTNIPPCCGSKIDDIAVGTNFAVALRSGVVYGWGANSRGQITIPKGAKSNIVSIAAGYAHVLAVNKTGTVVSWGNNESGQTKVPKSLKGVLSVAAGTQHSIAIVRGKTPSDNTMVIWGRNTEKQGVIPAGLRGVVAASGGFDHTMVLKTDGTVLAWGANAFGQSKVPDNVRDIKQISAGSYYSLALGNNGTVYAWGRNDNKQIDIPEGYRDIAVVGAGYVNTVIGLRDGRILALGAAENEALVSRTPTKTATPTP